MSNERKFEGFVWPHYTQTPDEYYDFVMQDLSLGEMRVLSYIIRRTLGFRRNEENISLDEMLNGRMTADGRVLDRGTGLSRSTLVASIRSLEEKGFIVVERRRSDDRGNERNIYRLNMQEPPFHGDQPGSDPATTSRSSSIAQPSPVNDDERAGEHGSTRVRISNPPMFETQNSNMGGGSAVEPPQVRLSNSPIDAGNDMMDRKNLEGSTKSGDRPVASLTRARARTRDNSYSYSSSDSYSDNSYSLELRQTELRQTEIKAGLDTGVSNPERPPQKIPRDPSVAGENETEKPERPFDLLAALCEELGVEVTTLSAADRAKQLAVAKRLLAAGATADEVRREARWLRSQSWIEGIDMFVIERHRAKWLLSGKPASARAVPLPEPFIVTGQMREEARSLGLSDEVIDRETDAFCDYYQANGKTMIDWEAAWRHWMRRAKASEGSRPRSRKPEEENKIAVFLRLARGERP